MEITEKVIAYLKENKREDALQTLIEAIEQDKKNPIHYINLGSILFEQKEYEHAERLFLRALEIDEEAAAAYYGLGSIYYEIAKYREAEMMLKKATQLQLNDTHLFYLLGMVYVKQKQNILALPFLQRATELTDDIQIAFQYGLTLAQTNHLEEAKNVFEKILKRDDRHADTLYNLAIIYILEEREIDGEKLLQKTLKVQPNHVLAKNALAQLHN